MLFYLVKIEKDKPDCELFLPQLFSSFIDPAHKDKRTQTFQDDFTVYPDVFNFLNIDGRPPSLADMCYMLQMILPGMLVLFRSEYFDERSDLVDLQRLPPVKWIESNEIKMILDYDRDDESRSYFSKLVKAAELQKGRRDVQ